jgi:ferredoxin
VVTGVWELRVDPAACLGSGMCAALAPELFQVEDVARVVAERVPPSEVALDAADQCPAQAITVVSEGVEIGPRP